MQDDATTLRTGQVVCRGPSTIVLMLTEPFGMAGRSVQFPMSSVLEEKTVAGHGAE